MSRTGPRRLEADLRAAERDGDKVRIAIAGNRLGLYHANRNAFGLAIPYFEKCLAAQHFMGDTAGMAVAALELGYAHYRLAQFDKALQYLYSVAESHAADQAALLAPLAQGLAGFAYLHKGDTARGEQYLEKAVTSFAGQRAHGLAARLCNKAAEYFILLDDYTRAGHFLDKVAAMVAAGAVHQARAARNKGIIDFRQDAFERAVAHFNASLDAADNLLVRKLKKEAFLKMAAVYGYQDRFDRADSCHAEYRKLKKAIAVIEDGRMADASLLAAEEAEKQTIIGLLSREPVVTRHMPSQQGLEFSRRLTAEEIERLSKEKALEQLNLTTIEKKEREREVALLSREKALQDLALSENQLELSRKTALTNALIGGSLVFVLAIFFLYSRYRYKKKANFELNKTNSELKEAMEKLKAAQEQLVYSRKMASLGELAAGIAHEIKNPLNFVNNFATFSTELLDEIRNAPPAEREALEDELKVNLAKVTEHGQRADGIVRNMQMLSRKSSGQKQPADVGRLLAGDIELAYSGFRAGHSAFECRFEKKADSDVPEAMVSVQDISRVFINVVSNGLYAMYLRAKAGDGHVPTLVSGVSAEGDHVVVRIRDNGTGIPEKIRDRIFDPFFTTRPAGTGAGLGLSISYDIVKAHGGEMKVDSVENEFTEVVITLPVDQPAY